MKQEKNDNVNAHGKKIKVTIQCEGEVLREFETFSVIMVGEENANLRGTENDTFWRYFHNLGMSCAYDLVRQLKASIMYTAAQDFGLIPPTPLLPDGTEEPVGADLNPFMQLIVDKALTMLAPKEREHLAKELAREPITKMGEEEAGELFEDLGSFLAEVVGEALETGEAQLDKQEEGEGDCDTCPVKEFCDDENKKTE